MFCWLYITSILTSSNSLCLAVSFFSVSVSWLRRVSTINFSSSASLLASPTFSTSSAILARLSSCWTERYLTLVLSSSNRDWWRVRCLSLCCSNSSIVTWLSRSWLVSSLTVVRSLLSSTSKSRQRLSNTSAGLWRRCTWPSPRLSWEGSGTSVPDSFSEPCSVHVREWAFTVFSLLLSNSEVSNTDSFSSGLPQSLGGEKETRAVSSFFTSFGKELFIASSLFSLRRTTTMLSISPPATTTSSITSHASCVAANRNGGLAPRSALSRVT